MGSSITFYGGAGGVTGSKHLIDVNDKRILLDCGTFQGLPDVRERNRSLPFAPESIDAVVLSHAHIDHCGMLPALVNRGFNGPIAATPATYDVAELMLKDAAGIEEQDAFYRKKHRIGAPEDREPLFTEKDVNPTLRSFVKVPYARDGGGWHNVIDGVRLKFYDAGHILGSAVSVLEIDTPSGSKRIAYTGDLGPNNMPLLPDPQVPDDENITTLLLESTYGGRNHQPFEEAMDRLAKTITDIHERGGKMIVPAFSLGRTQMIVYAIHKLIHEEKIPRFPIYVDSPLATNLTDVHRSHRDNYDPEAKLDFPGRDHVPLSFSNLTYTRSVSESKELNVKPGPYMVISASGMMTAGRVVHHLRHSIADPKNAVFITGYQARGTLGRQLLQGAEEVDLYGDRFKVRAEVLLFNEFSAHADRSQLKDYAANIKGLKQIALIHGEAEQADEFKSQLREEFSDWEVLRPDEGDVISLAK